MTTSKVVEKSELCKHTYTFWQLTLNLNYPYKYWYFIKERTTWWERFWFQIQIFVGKRWNISRIFKSKIFPTCCFPLELYHKHDFIHKFLKRLKKAIIFNFFYCWQDTICYTLESQFKQAKPVIAFLDKRNETEINICFCIFLSKAFH